MQTDIVTQAKLIAGKLNGIRKINLKGRNSAISSSSETVWPPGASYAQLFTAVAFEIVSSSANDTANGTGARTLSLDLIDGNHVASTVTVSMNGTTPVAITGTFLACNGIKVLTAGSTTNAVGTIDVRTVSGSVIKNQLSALGVALGVGEAASFIYTTPANTISILNSVDFSATAITGDLTLVLFVTDSLGVVRVAGSAKSSLYVTGFNGARGSLNLGSGIQVPEKSLIELRAYNSAGVGDLVANAELIQITLNSAANPSGNAWQV